MVGRVLGVLAGLLVFALQLHSLIIIHIMDGPLNQPDIQRSLRAVSQVRQGVRPRLLNRPEVCQCRCQWLLPRVSKGREIFACLRVHGYAS